ncbi:MAG: hypothetical protein KF830_06090 [Planctomycetes bacterium]|nr:hypothetical protein [Planctomycetota bacterium]
MNLLALCWIALVCSPVLPTSAAIPDGGGRRNLTLCEDTPILHGDGGHCITVTVTNLGGPNSKMTVSWTFADGTTGNVTLGQGESHTVGCNLTGIRVHETEESTGVVRWTVE